MVTLAELYDRLVDPARLASEPAPFHYTHQSSSYDRRSIDPELDGWFANHDWNEFVRIEERDGRTELVLLDAEGPGALVRMWSASAAGTLRVYIDGSEEPALVADMAELLGGRVTPYEEPFAYTSARGWNFYAPIPYQRRCVVTTDSYPGPELGGNLYYHVNTIRFPEGTEVETYGDDALAAASESIDRARRILADPSVLDEELQRLTQTPLELSTSGATTRVAADGAGSQIRRLEVRASDTSAEALRSTLLIFEFDGRQTVRVPLGDFFGGGPGRHEHVSLITERRPDGTMIARWAMPFTAVATVSLEGSMDVEVTGSIHTEPRPADERPMLYFHAGWRTNGAVPTRPRYDWNLATLTGRGQYVGTILNVTNPHMDWWGEGDERFYVDGETFPSYFGTGTEDYFGYAHTDTGYFARPFHGQPVVPEGPVNYGRTSNYRWHLLDPIPFLDSLRFDLEVWHWEDVEMPLEAIVIWYAAAGSTDGHAPPTPQGLTVPPLTAP